MGTKLVHATEECPHCHNLFSVARLAQHMNVCLRNPELLAALRVALEASPGVAKSREEYHATRDRATMPHPATLQNHAGSWAAVVALVGLEMPSNAGINAPLTEAEREVCVRRESWMPDENRTHDRMERIAAYSDYTLQACSVREVGNQQIFMLR